MVSTPFNFRFFKNKKPASQHEKRAFMIFIKYYLPFGRAPLL